MRVAKVDVADSGRRLLLDPSVPNVPRMINAGAMGENDEELLEIY
jgi:hypothetical protein